MTRSNEILKAAWPYIDDVQAYRGFILGADWADTHQHWRDAEEELPTHPAADSMTSLRVVVTDGYTCDLGYYCYDEQRWYTMIEDIKITHWAPLPELPKGGEEFNK